MTSKIYIYNTKLTPERNARVDSLEDYLGSLTATHSNESFQYIKIALDLVVRVDLDQKYVAGDYIGNYVKLVQDSKNYYFFITGTTWKAEHTVELSLSIDSVNTFASDFDFSDKTTIIRQHKDRFLTSDRLTLDSNNTLHQVVDSIDEGVTPVIMLKTTDTSVTEGDSKANQNWYLVYRTLIEDENSTPLTLSLVPKTAVPLSDSYVATRTITKSLIGSTNYFYFIKDDNSDLSFTANGNTYDLSDSDVYGYRIKGRDDPATTCDLQKYSNSLGNWTNVEYANTITVNRSDKYRLSSNSYSNLIMLINDTSTTDYKTGATGTLYSSKISDIDRSDTKVVNIIEIPYLPCDITWSGNNIVLPSGWTINKLNEIELNDVSTEFERSIKTINLPMNITLTLGDTYKVNKDKTYESKLKHSSLYNYKLAYDDNVSTIALERINRTGNTQPSIDVKFKPTNAITSDLMYHWTFNDGSYKENQDYETYISSVRNNQLGLYTSEYLSYLRVGYNYDRKEKQRSITTNWFTAGVSIAGAVLSFVGSGATGGISLVAAKSLATTAISASVNAISNTIQQEQQLQQKIDQLAAQSASITNTSAVDLLNWYNGNKLHNVTYKPTEQMQNVMFDLFHYCGYAVNNKAVPTTNSRMWFNYIQCEPVFTNEDTYKEFLDDIKARYNAGVTVYHKYNNEWDWAQQYENWENYLLTV